MSQAWAAPLLRATDELVAYALVFVLLAVQLFGLAWFLKSFVVAWIACVSLLVALAYYLKAPHWLGKRPDGRELTEIRPLSSEIGLLPRAHGSSLFTRGMTQALNVVTLAPLSYVQLVDTMEKDEERR